MSATLRTWARALKRDIVALWLAARDPRTPWYAKAIAGFVAAYALSPIDLIPDFIPVIGYLDDVILVPLGIALAVRLIPTGLMAELRAAAEVQSRLPASRWAGALVIAVWILLTLAAGWWFATHTRWGRDR